MSIYISSDFHAFHKNICKGISNWDSGATRDFDCEVKMTEIMAHRINCRIEPHDTLFFLGDWSFGGKDKIRKFREMLNCNNIHLVFGNHDTHIENNYKDCQKLFSSVSYYLEKYFNKTLFTMFHYPIGSWNGIGKGAINLHGHCHSSYERSIGKQMDVGVDTNNLFPYSIDEIFDIMSKKDIILVDHHNSESNLR